MPSPSLPLDALDPIGLEELCALAGLQDRVDVKHVVPWATALALVESLAPTHRVLDVDGRRAFAYATTYFDTLDLRCARDHLQGRRRRFKVRTRHYVDSDLRVVEVKLKGLRGRTVKHALVAPGPAAGRPLAGEALRFARDHVVAAYGAFPPGPLVPAAQVTYRRVTLASRNRPERVTLDLDLHLGAGRLAPGWVVVETKSRAGRSQADRALRALGQRPVASCSKYLLAGALARPELRANALAPLLRRCAGAAGRDR
jgi:hypothetical protein